ncbi:hypothetical protein F4801DRAFT_187576 [Xylaria longipes]|nr:hypothetical protein F4801DRAFT_187576 [Xylaria longipes]
MRLGVRIRYGWDCKSQFTERLAKNRGKISGERCAATTVGKDQTRTTVLTRGRGFVVDQHRPASLMCLPVRTVSCNKQTIVKARHATPRHVSRYLTVRACVRAASLSSLLPPPLPPPSRSSRACYQDLLPLVWYFPIIGIGVCCVRIFLRLCGQELDRRRLLRI